MCYRNYIDINKLNGMKREAYRIAWQHGWHDNPISAAQYLGLVITEAAEVVEADRLGKRAKTDLMTERLRQSQALKEELSSDLYEMRFTSLYKDLVKDSIEEEFADVIIRLLDMAHGIHGEYMVWVGHDRYGENYYGDESFAETLWRFTNKVLNWGMMNITDSVAFVYAWADRGRGICPEALDTHIRWKMKFNELRPYKHGGKKY